MLLPYIERSDLWENLVQGQPAAAAIEIFVCPSNPSQLEAGPGMSYLANAGNMRNERLLPEHGNDCSQVENMANGVFFDRTRGGGDTRDLEPKCRDEAHDPVYRVTFAHITSAGDGSTRTLMFAESLHAGVWIGINEPHLKWHYGFMWDDPALLVEALTNGPSRPDEATDDRFHVINGVTDSLATLDGNGKPRNSGFPSSHHPAGVNVAFVGGQIRFLRDRINPVVYAQLMTSNRKDSDLQWNGETDEELTQPDDSDF